MQNVGQNRPDFGFSLLYIGVGLEGHQHQYSEKLMQIVGQCVVSFRIRYMALMMRFLTYMMVEKRIVITISEDIYMRYIS